MIQGLNHWPCWSCKITIALAFFSKEQVQPDCHDLAYSMAELLELKETPLIYGLLIQFINEYLFICWN